jgi:putative ABC transport system permease protein
MSDALISIIGWPVAVATLLYQSLVLALAQVWANKVRAILTTLGILIGVAAVSSTTALIDGMTDRVIAEFEAFGATRLFIGPTWTEDGRRKKSWANVLFKANDFDEMLERCPSVQNYARVASFGAQPIAYRGRRAEERVNFVAIDAEWHTIERRDASMGRPLTSMDLQQARAVCVVNQRLRDELKLNRDPADAIVDVGFFGRVRIVGLVEQPVSIFSGDYGASEMLVPYSMATRHFPWPLYYYVTATTASRQALDDAKDEIEFYLRQKRQLRPGDPADFEISTSTRILEEINKTANFMTTVAGGIVAVSLLVGGVGIMNIMLVSVSERTREIGLRKAVGARSSAILTQFLVEAVVLCLIGGMCGALLGQAITSTVASYLPADLLAVIGGEGLSRVQGIRQIVVPFRALAMSLGFSACVGLVFGMFPAIKAAMLDPIEALRHE